MHLTYLNDDMDDYDMDGGDSEVTELVADGEYHIDRVITVDFVS
jgi:hypothetical protein